MDFCKSCSQRAVFMRWLEWWFNRRTHWANCCRPHENAPKTSLAESFHQSEKYKGSTQVSLLKCVMDDHVASQELSELLISYEHGSVNMPTRRRGLLDAFNKSTYVQMTVASANGACSGDVQQAHDTFVVDPCSTHRDDLVHDDAGIVVPNTQIDVPDSDVQQVTNHGPSVVVDQSPRQVQYISQIVCRQFKPDK